MPDRIDLTETLVLLGNSLRHSALLADIYRQESLDLLFLQHSHCLRGPLLGQVLDVTEICLFAFFHMGTSVMGEYSQ